MSPNWDGLRDVVTAYVSDAAPPGGDSPRAIVLAAIDRLRAALERPRPAPPERDRIELMAARAGSHDASWCSVHDAPRSRFECVNCFDELAAFALGGGSAGTGAAPPDVCNCWDKAPTIPTCRGPNTHLDDCPAKDSGLPVGVNWQREMARRLGTPSRKPCYSCATGHLDLLEIPVCDTCGNFLVSGRIAKVLDRVRGGAAQPPPSAPEPEPLDDICLKPPPGPERDAKTRVVIPLTEYRALIEENKRLRGSEPGPWSVRNFAADREPNGDWNIVANNGALRWCAAHLATEAEANEIRDALNRLAAVSGVPREETNP